MFVDFEKAFDNVWRRAPWFKLLYKNIRGEIYDIILKMYTFRQIKSSIAYNNEFSPSVVRIVLNKVNIRQLFYFRYT